MEWSEASRKLLELLKKDTKDKDRLGLCGAVTDRNMVLARSVNGWTSWLADPRIMKAFSIEDLKEVFEEFDAVARRFVKLDIKFTEKYGPKKQKKQKGDNLLVV